MFFSVSENGKLPCQSHTVSTSLKPILQPVISETNDGGFGKISVETLYIYYAWRKINYVCPLLFFFPQGIEYA